MPAQSQESKRAGMEAFLDIFEEFEHAAHERGYPRETFIPLFAAYIGRME